MVIKFVQSKTVNYSHYNFLTAQFLAKEIGCSGSRLI